MTASDGIETSKPEPSPEVTVSTAAYRTVAGVRDPLSKLTGTSVGAAIIAGAHMFNFGDQAKLALSEFGLIVGALISAYGPLARSVLVARYKEYGAQRLLKKMEKLAKTAPNDPDIEKKIIEARKIIMDAWARKIQDWRDELGRRTRRS